MIKPLPPSWYLHGELLATQTQLDHLGIRPDLAASNELTSDWQFVLNSSISTSPAFLLGRFCHGDPILNASVRDMCSWEQTQYPDDILAEVVHLPVSPSRAGNVVARPQLRQLELPYLTPSVAPSADQLRLADLAVQATDELEIILLHKPSGKRLRPRHTSAHNSQLGDEIYQFLALVQQQELDSLGWSWRLFDSLPALPRLVYKNLVVTPAQWTIRKDYLPPNTTLTVDYLLSTFQLPRFVLLIESENKLRLDLTFAPAQQILLDEVGKQPQVLLKEWIAQSYQPWVCDGEHTYVSELVIPLRSPRVQVRGRNASPSIDQTSPTEVAPVKRTFLPGDEWLYVKLYLHENVADDILINIIQPVERVGRQKGWIKRFFFIRYADPDFHLRVRFQANDLHYGDLLDHLQKSIRPSVDSGLIVRVQIDTYERELERYRPALITDCETIFSADSQLYLNWLHHADVTTESGRYTLASFSMDRLLSDFGFTLTEKTLLSQRLQQVFFNENGNNKELKRVLNKLYREREADVFTTSPLLTQFGQERSIVIKDAVATVRLYFTTIPSDAGFDQLVGSLIHMAMNRIFSSQARRHEMIIYHFMARHYEKLLALSKTN